MDKRFPVKSVRNPYRYMLLKVSFGDRKRGSWRVRPFELARGLKGIIPRSSRRKGALRQGCRILAPPKSKKRFIDG